MMIVHKHTYEYVIEDGVIVRNDTNKHFRTMKEISDELNPKVKKIKIKGRKS